jgi:autonomous glycyl radical cofactor GrcA
MLKIDNLAVSKELDRAEMSAIAGGSVFQNNAVNANAQIGGVSFGSAQTNLAPVTQVDASSHTNLDVKNIAKSVDAVGSLIGGVAL